MKTIPRVATGPRHKLPSNGARRRRKAARLGRWVACLSFLIVFAIASVGATRPGLGGIPSRATMRVGRGGLAIFYDQALSASAVRPVTVSWSAPTLTVESGLQSHVVELEDWQMASALALVLDAPGVEMLEVSVDSFQAGARNFYHSPALDTPAGPNPIAAWLKSADIAYASIVQGAPDAAKFPDLHAIAPIPVREQLLARDAEYQKLTRDLVTMPSTWPQIEFHVSDLSSAEPLEWKTDFQLRYIGADGSFVDPEASEGYIEPWMIAQTERPYDALRRGVEGDPRTRQLIREALPEVEMVEELALAVASLYAYCPANRTTCAAWRRALPALHDAPLPPGTSFFPDALDQRIHARAQQGAWDAAREAAWVSEPDPEYRRWIFIDQAISYFNGGTFPSRPLHELVPADHGTGQTKIALGLTQAGILAIIAAQSAPTPDASEVRDALRSVDTALAAAKRSKHRRQRELWQDRALLEYGALAHDLGAHPKTSARAKGSAEALFDECDESVVKAANRAAKKPGSADMDEWMYQLGRWERCQRAAMLWLGRKPLLLDLVRSAKLHYAIGMRAMTERIPKAAEHAGNRLRLLRSTATILAAEGLIVESVTISRLADELATRL